VTAFIDGIGAAGGKKRKTEKKGGRKLGASSGHQGTEQHLNLTAPHHRERVLTKRLKRHPDLKRGSTSNGRANSTALPTQPAGEGLLGERETDKKSSLAEGVGKKKSGTD